VTGSTTRTAASCQGHARADVEDGVMKLMAPRIDEAPARWIDRMAKSTAGPGWPEVDSGAIDGPASADAVGARLALDEGRNQQ